MIKFQAGMWGFFQLRVAHTRILPVLDSRLGRCYSARILPAVLTEAMQQAKTENLSVVLI